MLTRLTDKTGSSVASFASNLYSIPVRHDRNQCDKPVNASNCYSLLYSHLLPKRNSITAIIVSTAIFQESLGSSQTPRLVVRLARAHLENQAIAMRSHVCVIACRHACVLGSWQISEVYWSMSTHKLARWVDDIWSYVLPRVPLYKKIFEAKSCPVAWKLDSCSRLCEWTQNRKRGLASLMLGLTIIRDWPRSRFKMSQAYHSCFGNSDRPRSTTRQSPNRYGFVSRP